MPQVLLALVRSFGSCTRPGLWRYLLVPPLVAGLAWIVATLFWLRELAGWLAAATPLAWLSGTLGGWHLDWLATSFAYLGAWVILLAAAYLLAVLIAGAWAMPAMVAQLAATDYADVAPRGRDSVLLGAAVTLKATVRYLLGWALTLPVWIVPGMAVVHSFFWLAYLNRATFAYDALAAHASQDEWQRLRTAHGGSFWTLGFVAALLAHLPLFGLFAPALSALSFVHFGFGALRAERRNPASGTIEGQVIAVSRE